MSQNFPLCMVLSWCWPQETFYVNLEESSEAEAVLLTL